MMVDHSQESQSPDFLCYILSTAAYECRRQASIRLHMIRHLIGCTQLCPTFMVVNSRTSSQTISTIPTQKMRQLILSTPLLRSLMPRAQIFRPSRSWISSCLKLSLGPTCRPTLIVSKVYPRPILSGMFLKRRRLNVLYFFLSNFLHSPPLLFSSTTNVKLVRSTSNTGKNEGSLRSARGLLPPLLAAATLFIALAGGAVLYKRRQANNDEKGIDNLSPFGEETTMNDCTVSLSSTSPDKRGTNMSKEDLAEELLLQEEENNSKPPPSQERAQELAGWNEFVEQKPEENSQYSIEDFVEEAEGLLGVRIRYPGSSSISRQSAPEEDVQDCETTFTRVSV